MNWRQARYVVERVGRNLLPDRIAAWARQRFGGIPGGESDAPKIFADHYGETLAKAGRSFAGAEVLIFGHGPSFGFACELLAAGSRHAWLFDPYAEPDPRLNERWLAAFPDYLERRGEEIRPRGEWMTVLDATDEPAAVELPKVDLVVSTSVFEHLTDVDFWTGRLAAATRPDGFHVHMIDLRDHFFHVPFEMLCYSRATWRRWLNPRQHLNRWRLPQYEAAFRRCFREVEVEVLDRDREAFAAARPRIRPEFLTGDPEIDSVIEIEVTAGGPLPPRHDPDGHRGVG